MSTAAAVILWTGASFYAIFGGADFGGGFWDLIAGDAKKGWQPRMAIQRSLTPVWEANHVWLIFILVVLWTAFPTAFSAIFTTLYVPLVLAVLGIVLRGSGFAFRKSIEGLNEQRAAGATFALSSVITPFFMGTVVGAIAAGNVPANGNGDAFSSWIAPLPLFIGAMFVATSAYLAAIFLVGDSRRAGDRAMELYFEKRALIAGAVAGIFAVVGLIALHSEGHYVYHRLLHQGLPIVIVSAVCGLAALAALLLGGLPLAPLQPSIDRHTAAAAHVVADVLAPRPVHADVEEVRPLHELSVGVLPARVAGDAQAANAGPRRQGTQLGVPGETSN